eukprot:3722292-Ditylum_brightwellii.AAC.1
MKAVSKDYIPKTSEIITAANIKKLVTKNLSDNTPKKLACKVYTALVYFGLLQNSKAFKIKDTDITHNKQIKKLNINFPYALKHCKKKFSSLFPSTCIKIFEEKLGLAEKILTAHFGKRSGAAALADA